MKKIWTVRLALALIVAAVLDTVSTYIATPDLSGEANPFFVMLGSKWTYIVSFKVVMSLLAVVAFAGGLRILQSRVDRLEGTTGFVNVLSHLIFKRRVSLGEVLLYGWPKDWPSVFAIGSITIGISIVTGVFGILAAIAIPAFLSMLPGMRLNGAARQVMGDLMAARMMAVKENKQFKVTFLGDNHSYQISRSVDSDNDEIWDSWEITSNKDIQSEYDGVTFSFDNSPIFNPRGTNSNPNLTTITLQNTDGGCKQVSVNIAGLVKIQECGD